MVEDTYQVSGRVVGLRSAEILVGNVEDKTP